MTLEEKNKSLMLKWTITMNGEKVGKFERFYLQNNGGFEKNKKQD